MSSPIVIFFLATKFAHFDYLTDVRPTDDAIGLKVSKKEEKICLLLYFVLICNVACLQANSPKRKMHFSPPW